MLNLIPSVKEPSVYEGQLARKSVCYTGTDMDSRVLAAIQKLNCDPSGTPLEIAVTGGEWGRLRSGYRHEFQFHRG